MYEFANKGDKPTKNGFGEGVRDAARMNPKVVGLGADISASAGMNLFAAELMEKYGLTSRAIQKIILENPGIRSL